MVGGDDVSTLGTQSILKSVKKFLGLADDYDVFDLDIIMHINTVFTDLHQVGLGKEDAFYIEDDTATWGDFLGDEKNMNSVKTYVAMSVRLLFDPPTTSFAIQAMEKQLEKLEWRLHVQSEQNRILSSTVPITTE